MGRGEIESALEEGGLRDGDVAAREGEVGEEGIVGDVWDVRELGDVVGSGV